MERITEKGIERLVSNNNGIEVWAVVTPAQEFIAKLSEGAEERLKEERRIELLAQIKLLEEKIFYSMLDADEEWVASKKAQRAILKQELESLK